MKKLRALFAAVLLFLSLPALCSAAAMRALLVACSEFVTQPSLGNASSGNLQMIGSALLGVSPRLEGLSIEDGTIGTVEALGAAVADAFGEAAEDDLSILYLCTHGVLSSSDDEQVYLLLGDGRQESPLSSAQLYELVAPIQGEKLLILDACHSGALIGRGYPGLLPGEIPAAEPKGYSGALSGDPSVHVLTSATGAESSWYYDSKGLSSGALSYFASAFSVGLGLYGNAEADLNGDGGVTLAEMQRYLNESVPSSSSQLLSVRADSLVLPAADRAMLTRPLSGFTYGPSLLSTADPTLDFSFTASRESAVQYRLVDYDNGRWNWEEAKVFLDEGADGSGVVPAGRHSRSLALADIAPDDSGYLMLQVFSVTGGELILCSERLIAVQPAVSAAQLSIASRGSFVPGSGELPVTVSLSVPAQITLSVFDAQGSLVRRICTSQLTRPGVGSVTHLYWDGRNSAGEYVSDGTYTLCAEASVSGKRQKAVCSVLVTP